MALRDILTRFRFSVQSGKLRSVTAATRAAERRMRSATRQARRLTGALSGIGGRLGMALGMGALSAATAGLGAGILRANVEFQRLRATMVTVTGDAESAAEALDFAAGFAARTPFQIGEVTQAYIALRRRGVDPTAERLTALGDIAAANSRQLEDLMGGITGAVSAGTTRMLEGATGMDWAIRGNQIIATQWDGTRVTIDRTTEAMVAYLTQLGQMSGIAGGMARQSATLGGRISNLKDQVWQLFVALGEAGLSDVLGTVIDRVRELASAIKKWASDRAKVKRYLEMLTKGAKAAGVAMAAMVLGRTIRGIVTAAEVIHKLGVAGMWAQAKLLLVPAAILALLLGIEDLVAFTQGKDSLFGRLLDRAGIDPEPIRESLRQLGESLQTLWAVLQDTGGQIHEALLGLVEGVTVEDVARVLAGVVVAIAATLRWIVGAFQRTGEAIGRAMAAAWLWILDVWDTSVQAIADLLTWLDRTFGEMAASILAAWTAAAGAMLDAAVWLGGQAVTIFGAWLSWIADAASTAAGAISDAFWTVVDTAISIGTAIVGAIGTAAGAIVDAAVWIADTWSWAWDQAYAGAVWLADAVMAAFSAIGGFFSGLFDSAISGLMGVVEDALNAVAGILDELPDFVLEELPSSVYDFARHGVDLTSAYEDTRQSVSDQAAAAPAPRPEITPRPERPVSPGVQRAAQLAAVVDAGISRGTPGLPSAATVAAASTRPTTVSRSTSVSISGVTIPVTGSVDMSAPELLDRIRLGAEEVLARAVEATYADTAQLDEEAA